VSKSYRVTDRYPLAVWYYCGLSIPRDGREEPVSASLVDITSTRTLRGGSHERPTAWAMTTLDGRPPPSTAYAGPGRRHYSSVRASLHSRSQNCVRLAVQTVPKATIASDDIDPLLVCNWGGWNDLEAFLDHYRGRVPCAPGRATASAGFSTSRHRHRASRSLHRCP
jgi:hypothetical protein